MSNALKRRLSALEDRHGPARTLYAWLPLGLSESEQAEFIAAEKLRLGVSDGDDLVTISWMEPTEDAKPNGTLV